MSSTTVHARSGAPVRLDGAQRQGDRITSHSPTVGAAPAARPWSGSGSRVTANIASPLFREQVVRAMLDGEVGGPVLDAAPPRAWALFAVLASVVICAFGFAFVGEVEMVSRGRGALRVAGGPVPVRVEVGGLVAEVHARSGENVAKGQPLLRIHSSSVKAQLLEADAHLERVDTSLARLKDQQRDLYEQRAALLKGRVALLRGRSASLAQTAARQEKKLATLDGLASSGFAAKAERDDASEQLEQTTRQRISVDEELTQTLAQIVSLESDRQNEVYRLTREASETRIKRDALAFALEQTTVLAPQSGVLESLAVHPGEALEAGQVVGKLVPEGRPTEVVAFLPEADRAFVEVGRDVRVEIDQLPVGEFGALRARVTRVGADPASAYEVNDVLGKEAGSGAAYRVELAITPDAQSDKLTRFIRSGVLVQVRVPLRRRRIITLVLEPLRHWFR